MTTQRQLNSNEIEKKTIGSFVKKFNKKQLTVLNSFFIILFLVFLGAILSYPHADNFSLIIKSETQEALSLINVYKLSPQKRIAKLIKTENTWDTKNKYIKKIWVAFPENGIDKIKEIQINIGDKIFEFSKKDLAEFKIIHEPKLLEYGKKTVIVEIPDSVTGKSSIFFHPFLKNVINWGGDVEALMYIVKNFVFCVLCLLFISILLRLDDRKILFHLYLVFFITVAIIGFFSIMQVDPHHDGIMLKPAVDVADGKMLYRDTFSQYGPLTTLFQAAAIKLFGKYLIVIRLLTALTYGLISVLLWLIYSRILPKWLSTFCCLLWLFLGYFFINHPAMLIFPWSTVFAIFIILLSLYFMILFLEKQKYFLLFMVGICSSAAFWFKINYGIISFISMFLLLSALTFYTNKKNLIKSLLIFLSGNFIVHGVFLIWLAINKALGDFILQTVKLAFVFSNNNNFSTNDFFVIKIIKILFQIGSNHGGRSLVWTILPVIAVGVWGYSLLVLRGKNILLSDKIIFAVSSMAIGLWLCYYPINALLHVYLSSVLFFGLFAYFLLKMTEEINVKKKKIFLVVVVILLTFSQDISVRISEGFRKISDIKKYKKIEEPNFLKGMYVSTENKQIYYEIEKLFSRFPDPDLINLTNSGLFSLYKDNNNEFHKMYVNWEWNNSYLYQDYIGKLNQQIASKPNIIFSSDNFMIDEYIPIRVFPVINNIIELAQRTIVLVPGRAKNIFKISVIDCLNKSKDVYLNKSRGFCHIKLTSEKTILINSIVAKIFTEYDIPKYIDKYEFEYNIIPRIFNQQDRQFVKKLYTFDIHEKKYMISEMGDETLSRRLINIFSNIFLYEKYFHITDTFKNSPNNKIDVYLNKKFIKYHEQNLLDLAYFKNDIIDLAVPIENMSPEYIFIKLRINYNENCYHEENIVLPAIDNLQKTKYGLNSKIMPNEDGTATKKMSYLTVNKADGSDSLYIKQEPYF